MTLPSISEPVGMSTWPPWKTSEATRVRKVSPSWLSAVERRLMQADANGGSLADFTGGQRRG